MNENNPDIVSTLINIFNNSNTNYIIRLYNTPIEEFDIEFNKIIDELQQSGESDYIEKLQANKEALHAQVKIFYKYKKFDEEKQKRACRSYYLSALKEAFNNQQSDDRTIELLGDITTLQTYIHYMAALIEKGSQNNIIINIYRHLQTHLFDVLNDIMSICNFENIEIPREISDDLFNLSIGINKEYEDLIAEIQPYLLSGFSFCRGE